MLCCRRDLELHDVSQTLGVVSPEDKYRRDVGESKDYVLRYLSTIVFFFLHRGKVRLKLAITLEPQYQIYGVCVCGVSNIGECGDCEEVLSEDTDRVFCDTLPPRATKYSFCLANQ